MTWKHRTEQEQAREVEAWRRTNQTAYAFAKANGYSKQSLRRWAEQYDKRTSRLPAIEFARVDVVREVPAELVVEVGGARVRVQRGFDAELLRNVVETLGTRRSS